MAVSNIRFKNMAQIRDAVKRCHFVKHTVAQDERGFYFSSYEVDPRVVAMNEEADARARANLLAREAANEAAGVEPTPSKERKARPINEDGPVHRIRRWARENPEATPADAVAHFADLHPATVKIQLRKVRKGEV